MSYKLETGDGFKLRDQIFTILEFQRGNVVAALPNGRQVILNFAELISDPSFEPNGVKTLRPTGNDVNAVSMLNEAQREQLSQRYSLIEPIILWEEARIGDRSAYRRFLNKYSEFLFKKEELAKLRQEQIVQRVALRSGVSRSTIMRSLKAFRSNGRDIASLIPNTGQGYTGRQDTKSLRIFDPNDREIVLDVINTRLSEKHVEVLERVIPRVYLTKQRRRKTAVARQIEIECKALGIPPIPYITVSKILDRIDPSAILRKRHSSKASALYDEITRGYSEEMALKPLDVVQIDHTRWDVECVDDTRQYTLGRPWVTLGIDVFSREPWCLYVSFEDPSADVVKKAIEHGVFFKNVTGEFGTIDQWDAFGIPETIYVDNGKPFHSKEIKFLVENVLQSELQYRPVKEPNYGGVIERLFGTINSGVLHDLPGSTKSSVADKGEYDSDKNAALTLDELRQVITIWLVDVYCNGIHSSLPNETPTPRLRYFEGIGDWGLPRMEERSKESASIEYMLTDHRMYSRDGIRFEGRFYRAYGRSDLINSTVKYEIKHNPDDISVVYVKDMRTNDYVEAQCYNPPYDTVVGMNRYTYEFIQKEDKLRGGEKRNLNNSENKMNHGMQRVDKLVTNAEKATKRVRRQVQRMKPSSYKNVESQEPARPSQLHEDRVIEEIRQAQKELWGDSDE